MLVLEKMRIGAMIVEAMQSDGPQTYQIAASTWHNFLRLA